MARQATKNERRPLWESHRLRKVVQETFEGLEEVNAVAERRDRDLQAAVRRV